MSSRNEASGEMVGYYSYLFTFPSREIMIFAVILISIISCTVSFVMIFGVPSYVEGVTYGLFGLSAPLIISDFLISPMFKSEVIMNPRRFNIITFFSSIIFALFFLLYSSIGVFLNCVDIIPKALMMGTSVNTLLRNLSIRVLTTEKPWKKILGVFLQPALILLTACFMIPIRSIKIILQGIIGITILLAGNQLLFWVLDRWKGETPEIKLLQMFRAFMLAWTEGNCEALENEITKLGETMDLSLDTIIFGQKAHCHCAFITPYIHPGPFRNVGSGDLPNVLVEKIGHKLGCETIVTHGVSTHKRDLTNSQDVLKVADLLAKELPAIKVSETSSPFIRVNINEAQASCQMFGDVALLTLSLSPKNYDDLPESVFDNISKTAEKNEVKAVIIDSHNSILPGEDFEDYNLLNLCEAASEALKQAKNSDQIKFSVGVRRVYPKEWGLDDGVGPNGIAVLVIRLINGHTSAYVVIDGNNMISGLREKILEATTSRGFDEVEVMTSDTHLVTAIISNSSGYHPIGEKTDWEKILEYVLKAMYEAVSNLKSSHFFYKRTTVPRLNVLGDKGLNTLSRVIESGFSLFKRTGIIITPISFLLALIIIFLV